MASKSENRRINLYINGKEVKNEIKSIRNEYFKMINEQSRMIRGSKEYYQHAQEIKRLKNILDDHNKHLGRVGKAWQNIKQIMYGVVGGNILTSLFNRISMAIPNLISSLAKLDDKFADVAKTTGLTSDQVKELHKDFKNIDTRSSRKELLDLARIAGKLGIEGKKNIFDFVKAADQINVALSEDLGGNAEEAINHIGKLVDVFKLKEKFTLEESMLKTGSAINALGAASTASEAYLVEFAKRVAGVAPMADISIESVLGLGATLDQLGQQSEVSSTVFSQVIPDMFKDTATYADVAGMSVKDFTNLLNTDANEAFIKVLEGLKGNNEGFTTLVEKLDALELDGKRSISVLGVLANNTQLLRDQQKLANDEFEKGTSLTEEFNKKNENMAAKLEKISKWINAKWMNSDLMTFFENLVNKAAEYVKIPVSETMEVERIKVNSLAIEMTNANTTAERRNEIYNELKGIAPDVVANIDAENISIEILRGNLAKYNDEMIKKIAIQESEETLVDKRNEYGKVVGERAKAELDLTNELFKLKEKIAKVDQEAAKHMENILISQSDILDKDKQAREIADAILHQNKMAASLSTTAANTAYKVTGLRAEELSLQEQLNKSLKSYTDLYNRIFGNPDEFIGPPDAAYLHEPKTPKVGGGGTDPGKKTKKPYLEFDINSVISLNKQKEVAYKDSRDQIVLDLEKSYQQEANIRQIAHNNEMAALGTDEEAKKALDQKFKRDEALRLAAHLQELIAKTEEILQSGGLEGVGIADAMLTDEEKEALLSKIEELKVKISELNADAARLQKEEESDIFGMNPDDWEKLWENVGKALTIAQQIGDIWSAINTRLANQENESLLRFERNTQDKKKALDKQLKAGLISQEKYNTEVEELDSKYDEEKRKLEREQAKRQRIAAIFQILLSTGMAVMNAATTQPFMPLGLIMMALAAALGAAQLAALPKVPEYAEGGFTHGDKMYRAGEEGQEWIAPNWMTEHPYINPVIRDLERVRIGEPADNVFRSPVGPEYYESRTSARQNDFYKNSTADYSRLDRLIEQNNELLQYMKDPKNRRAIIVHDDLSRYEDEIALLQELGKI